MSKLDILAFIVIILLFIGGFYLIVKQGNEQMEFEECLKPFAKEYCENKGLILKKSNRFAFFCAEDMRMKSDRYDYLNKEKLYCSDVNQEKGEVGE